ncbi:hypothetical protein [Nostoc sp. UHCC 0252]|nr:hypothetical protein [Nostoc sp. UHCC 0252]MEA5603180.1 hypothetical protein [Nostoc sp. UHCC 0252]
MFNDCSCTLRDRFNKLCIVISTDAKSVKLIAESEGGLDLI